MEKTEPIDARFLVERTLRQIRTSEDLLESERAPLVRQLQARLAEVDNLTLRRRVDQDVKSEPYVDKPRKSIAGDPSDGVSGFAKKYTDSAKGTQAKTQSTIREREQNIAKINLGIEKSSMPSDDPIQLPKYWKELTESRKKMMGAPLSEKEVKVLKTLNSTVTIDYKSEKFKDVLNHLQERTGLTLIMDEGSVQELNLDYDDQVTQKLGKVTVRTALKKILGDKGLTYIIKEGALQVMTPKKASEYTVIRTYPIDALISPVQMQNQFMNPFLARVQMLNNAQGLINLIQGSVEPSYWQPNGPGSIVFEEVTRSLVIRASAEMHYQLPSMIGR